MEFLMRIPKWVPELLFFWIVKFIVKKYNFCEDL